MFYSQLVPLSWKTPLFVLVRHVVVFTNIVSMCHDNKPKLSSRALNYPHKLSSIPNKLGLSALILLPQIVHVYVRTFRKFNRNPYNGSPFTPYSIKRAPSYRSEDNSTKF